MHIDLDTPMLKVTHESERCVLPAETVERAIDAAARLGVTLDARVIDTGGIFFVAKLTSDYRDLLPEGVKHVRLAGKGPSRDQCLASCYMELMERASLYRYLAREPKGHICLDLRENREYDLFKVADLSSTVCVAAGNHLEEAVLHALHELVETRIEGAYRFAPYKWVPFEVLETPYPDWVKDNFLLIKTPSRVPSLHHVTAMQYPEDGVMDMRVADRAIKADGRIFFTRTPRHPNHHSPASGAAAGLNLDRCAERAMAEVLQGSDGALGSRKRKMPPPRIPAAGPEDVIDYETDSVTGDIRAMLDALGEDVFVGAVDLTDPALQIPVVKLISDYNPHCSYISDEVLDLFYESGPA